MNLPTLVLATLKSNKRKAITGYDLTKIINDLKLFMWQASHQQVYRELGKLEASGLVTHTVVPQVGKPDRKEYQLTKQGHEQLARLSQDAHSLPPIRDKLAAHIVAAKTQSFELTEQLLTDYEEKREAHIEEMKNKKSSTYARDWLMSLLLERQIQIAEIDLAWIGKIKYIAKCREIADQKDNT